MSERLVLEMEDHIESGIVQATGLLITLNAMGETKSKKVLDDFFGTTIINMINQMLTT